MLEESATGYTITKDGVAPRFDDGTLKYWWPNRVPAETYVRKRGRLFPFTSTSEEPANPYPLAMAVVVATGDPRRPLKV